eukprot:4655038-Amphidinium_carterae.1
MPTLTEGSLAPSPLSHPVRGRASNSQRTNSVADLKGVPWDWQGTELTERTPPVALPAPLVGKAFYITRADVERHNAIEFRVARRVCRYFAERSRPILISSSKARLHTLS